MTTQTPDSQKWYKNYMVTVFVIGLPALVVVACIFFVFFAVKTKDSPVRDDWYMDGKTLYQDASKDQLAYDLGVHGVLRLNGDEVVLELSYPTDRPLPDNAYPKTLELTISHATDKNKDQDVTLTHHKDNLYTGKVTIDPLSAKYYIHLNHTEAKWRLTQSQKLPAQNVALSPLPAFDESKLALPDQRDKRHLANAEQATH